MKSIQFTLSVQCPHGEPWSDFHNFLYSIPITQSNKSKMYDIVRWSPYYFSWQDGTLAVVTAKIGNTTNQNYFPGYKWMIDSIIKYGYITPKLIGVYYYAH